MFQHLCNIQGEVAKVGNDVVTIFLQDEPSECSSIYLVMKNGAIHSHLGMDQLKWTTPIKSANERDNLMIKSPVIYKTPVKQYERNPEHMTHENSIGSFSVLPSHITPPSGLTKFIARNPFETDLINRLHLSMISPTVFRTVSSASQQSPDFSWSTDELALIKPAEIEEFANQQIHCTDSETEIRAQAAIDKFFNENEIISSPWDIKVDTPLKASNNSNSESSKSKKDGWSQTVLTFPSELPSHVIEVSKPYFTFTQEQNVQSDDANSSNNSLVRKLFFKDEDDNEEDSSDCLSPVKMNGSLVISFSPPQSGILVHGTPLKLSVFTLHELVKYLKVLRALRSLILNLEIAVPMLF